VSTLDTSYDVVIIGGGPAGSTAATLLHRAGHKVCVLEKTEFPRFIIGESLLPRCMDVLEEAGLLDVIKEQNFMVKNGALFLRGDESCSFDFADQYTKGWEYTWQVPRDQFDEALTKGARAQGVPFFFKHAVTDVTVGAAPSVTVALPDGSVRQLSCKFVVDASGYGRVLPKLLGLNTPSDLPKRSSYFAHVTGDKRPAGDDEGRIWIISHRPDVWMWVIPFSNGVTSVGVVGPPAFFQEHPGDTVQRLKSIFASDPVASVRLADVDYVKVPEPIDGYSIGVKRLFGEGYCLVGNATEFLDPVFSAGVTLALESASRAAKVISAQLRGETVDWSTDYADYMTSGIETFRTYVNAWYDGSLLDIFFHASPPPAVKQQICSVLAGYAWDDDNPFVREHSRKVPQLSRLVTT
jgi:flavin-dependent dehydrogenase